MQYGLDGMLTIDGSNLSEQNMPSKAFLSNMYVRNNGKVGILKASGEDFIPVKYDSLGVYSDSMLVAKVGAKYGFLNEEGKETVAFIYSQAYDYSEGLAAVVNENGKYLFIDKLGNIAIKPKKYDRVGKFMNGTCKVYSKDKVWEIDREGKKVKDSKKKADTDNVDECKSNDDIYVRNSQNVKSNDSETSPASKYTYVTPNYRNNNIFRHNYGNKTPLDNYNNGNNNQYRHRQTNRTFKFGQKESRPIRFY